jgi:hypothetical protein
VTILPGDAVCFGEASGTAQAIVTGANGSASFFWSNGDTTELIAGLLAGPYAVTVTDTAGCLFIAMTTVSQPPAIMSICTITHETAEDAGDGTIVCTISGGTAPYSYLWSSGDTSTSLNNLAPGLYILTITDNNGCTRVDSAVVNGFACNVLISINVEDVTCFGDSSGSILADASGGSGPYQYQWSNGMVGPMLSELAAGTYQLTVTDDDACVSTMNVLVAQPDALVVSVDSIYEVTGGANGGIFITISGGTPPYSVIWTKNGEQISTDEDITGLSAGEYILAVMDTNNCVLASGTISVQVTTGIRDLAEVAAFRIAPNPASTNLYLSTEHTATIERLTILSPDGSIIGTHDLPAGIPNKQNQILNLTDLNAGLYYLVIQSAQGTEVHPFIKIH